MEQERKKTLKRAKKRVKMKGAEGKEDKKGKTKALEVKTSDSGRCIFLAVSEWRKMTHELKEGTE